MTIRFAGVYDLRTIKNLQEKRVNHFAFDFRPRSMNFIQEHLCLKILKSTSFDHIYLQFDNEKDFIIERIFKTISDNFEGKVLVEYFNIDLKNQSLPFPFIYNVNTEEIPNEIIKSDMLKGFSIQSDFLCRLKEQGTFESWLNSFYTSSISRSNGLIHILSRDWDDDIFPSLYDLLDFDLISLSINSKVESCFRNVDLNKLNEQLSFITR